jgi:hypothetical protein
MLLENSTSIPTKGTSSLRATSMEKLVTEACRSSIDELTPVIENAKLLSDFHQFLATVRQKFYPQPNLVSESSAGCHLLGMALDGESTIDVSPFQTIGNRY